MLNGKGKWKVENRLQAKLFPILLSYKLKYLI